MRETSSECHTHTSHVRAMTEMCSRESPAAVLQHHPALAKANGKSLAGSQHHVQQHQPPQQQPQQQSRPNSRGTAGPEARLQLGHEDDLAGTGNNGTASGNSLPTPGGRLKFFKDGKFILELSHRRDGERTTWFPVPKKTFWPPTSAVTPNRQESSASLSVSDDNSSIQSSPWQRDHCWKQSIPRRNISTEFNFYYRRNPKMRLNVHPRLIARKRRQPLDPSSSLAQLQESMTNYQKPQLQSQPQPVASVRKLNGGGVPSSKSLNIIIDKLARLLDPNVVSPRKRILRELGRVSLEDQVSKRRATPPQPTHSSLSNEPMAPASRQLSSYSITSILGEDKPSADGEPGFLRNLLKPQDRQQHQSQQQSPQHQQHHLYPRAGRLDGNMSAATAAAAYLGPNAATSMQQPLYGLPILPPVAYRASPFCWSHYSQQVHYPPPMPLYPVPPQPSHHTPSPSPPAHRYKDYRDQTLTPPSDKPLNLSKHAG